MSSQKGSVGPDGMSSADLFGERCLLTNIRTVKSWMKIVVNADTMTVTQMGIFPSYGDVSFYRQAIANVLSLKMYNSLSVYRMTVTIGTNSWYIGDMEPPEILHQRTNGSMHRKW